MLRSAADRLQRLLVILPWLMEVGQTPVAEVARRFDMTVDDVEQDLELVAMCGLPPFVDEMIDVFVDDGTVFVGIPRLFTKPLRLTAPEGFALLAAGRAAMELPGADPQGALGRGLAKLAAALDEAGVGVGDVTAGVVVDLDRPPLTDRLVDWVASSSELTISYYSPDRDAASERAIVPRYVFVDAGRWYVVADDARSGAQRTFRIDRIERAETTGRVVPSDIAVDTPPRFFADPDLERATLRLSPNAAWVAEQYPVDHVTPCDSPAGWIEVRLPYANSRWLSRLLIRLGPDVDVVEPSHAVDDARALARRMLARYRPGTAPVARAR